MNQYIDMFIEESKEHLQAINKHLLEFEKNVGDLGLVNEIFRSAHTLKGMSATMGFEAVAALTHEMENVLDLIRNQELSANEEIIEIIFNSVDRLEEMIHRIIESGDASLDASDIVKQLVAITNGEALSAFNDLNTEIEEKKLSILSYSKLLINEYDLTVLRQSKELQFTVYRIVIYLREDCMLKAVRAYMVNEELSQQGEIIKSFPSTQEIEAEEFENSFELLFVTKEAQERFEKALLNISEIDKVETEEIDIEKLELEQNAIMQHTEARVETASASAIQERSTSKGMEKPTQVEQKSRGISKTIRVNVDRLDVLMNLFSELVIDRGRLERIAKELNHPDLKETVEHMNRISGDLQNIVLNMRMVPIEQVFNRFPKMIRGLARDLNKKVNLQISGEETELDRTVIDEIGDPLVHLIRNALDHGLETTQERIELGKPEEGHVHLSAYHSGNHVFIDISDDGKGISRQKILQKAVENRLLSPEMGDSLSDEEVYQLLFASGFSTAEELSDISGRGVGLDVVRMKIESLGGQVYVHSELGQGTTFSIQLPLTLSILTALLVYIAEETYAIPLTSIVETAKIKQSEIITVHKQKVIDFRGKIVPLVDMRDFYQIPAKENDTSATHSVVIVSKGDKMAALLVDSFVEQQEIVLKSLGNYLTNILGVSGATILGDGHVALIVDCNAIIK